MPPAPELEGARRALVIATATYADPALRQLRSPAQDATDMGEVLADPSIGGFEVTTLIDRPEYEVRREVDSFLADRVPDDLVVLYLSSHGVLDARGRLYFAATDTTKARLSSTGVESTWLLDRLEDCRARRQVLILDCCFSGAFARTKGAADVDLERRLIGAGRGRAVLTASRAGEYSYEGEPLADRPTGSVFTAGLVTGLRTGEADRDGDGYITVEDAYAYAADHVQAQGGAQSPQRWLYGGEDTVVLARNPAGAKITPTRLPDALRLSLESPYSEVRQAATRTVAKWLNSDAPGEVLAAQQELQRIATEDNPRVATTARELLRAPSRRKPHAPESPSVPWKEPTSPERPAAQPKLPGFGASGMPPTRSRTPRPTELPHAQPAGQEAAEPPRSLAWGLEPAQHPQSSDRTPEPTEPSGWKQEPAEPSQPSDRGQERSTPSQPSGRGRELAGSQQPFRPSRGQPAVESSSSASSEWLANASTPPGSVSEAGPVPGQPPEGAAPRGLSEGRSRQGGAPRRVPDTLARPIQANTKWFERWVLDVAFSPDGRRLVSVGTD